MQLVDAQCRTRLDTTSAISCVKVLLDDLKDLCDGSWDVVALGRKPILHAFDRCEAVLTEHSVKPIYSSRALLLFLIVFVIVDILGILKPILAKLVEEDDILAVAVQKS